MLRFAGFLSTPAAMALPGRTSRADGAWVDGFARR